MASDETKGQPARGGAGRNHRKRRRGATSVAGRRRGSACRWSRLLLPRIVGLEVRRLLSTITWDSKDYPKGGSWDIGSNWIDGVVPTAGDDVVIDLTSTGSVSLGSSQADAANSVTTNSGTTLDVANGSLSLAQGAPRSRVRSSWGRRRR